MQPDHSSQAGTTAPILLSGFPRAIAHVDGDAFFTSVEQAIHPELRGRPVVTGRERGIIACASYEARALGIRRGVALWEAQRRCPALVVLPSDYETYSLYSTRMCEILRSFTPWVETYSIDEAFADITGARRVFHDSYEGIARRMRDTIRAELDISVSVGLSLTKTLAKLASDFRKPNGLTAVAGRHIHRLLERIPLADVWGIGPNTTALLQRHGLRTALDYVRRPEPWVAKLLGKLGRELWRELRGETVHALNFESKTVYATIRKGQTFSAPSADPDYIYARLAKNLQSAFIKLRRHRLRTAGLTVVLTERDYTHHGYAARLNRPTAATLDAMPVAHELFTAIVQPGIEYRSTMVILENITADGVEQYELFEDPVRIERRQELSRIMDRVNATYGKHSLTLGPALFLQRAPRHDRDTPPWRRTALLNGETPRQRLAIPRLDITV